MGSGSLFSDQNSSATTAVGYFALNADTSGSNNMAIGWNALSANDTGYFNTAGGASALAANNGGGGNTAFGYSALTSNTTASDNTAIGDYALYQSTGNNDTGLGVLAGSNLTAGNNNIYICNQGAASESNTIRIGNGYGGNQTAAYIAGIYGETVGLTGEYVVINANGQLGTTAGTITGINPNRLNNAIANLEERNTKLEADIASQRKALALQEQINAQQQKEISTLTASLKEQASLLQKVCTQLQLNKSAPEVVSNN